MVATIATVTSTSGTMPLINSLLMLTSASKPNMTRAIDVGRSIARVPEIATTLAAMPGSYPCLIIAGRLVADKVAAEAVLGAADCAQTGASHSGRHAEFARHPANPCGSSLEEVIGDATDQNELGHQQEHRDGDEFVGGDGRQRSGLQYAREHRHAANKIKPENSRAGHRKANWRTDRQQHEQHNHYKDQDHSKVSPAAGDAGRAIMVRPSGKRNDMSDQVKHEP